MIVANDVSQAGIGFSSDDNAATVFWCDGQQEFPVMSKQQLAENIVRLIAKHNNK
jgi:phosphopantothenoylcysteine decarboxylase/phosphopantothenate--cysteine ligase